MSAKALKLLTNTYTLDDTPLGYGAFGIIYRASTADGAEVALKCVRSDYWLPIEYEHLALLNHPHIIKVIEVCPKNDITYLVMEYMAGGDLYEHMANRGVLPEPLARLYFSQLLQGLKYAHDHGIFHQDLKPENLLLNATHTTLKIADWGLSVRDLYYSSTFSPSKKCQLIHMTPEILKEYEVDSRAYDIWSCGLILHFMITGDYPFNNLDGSLNRAKIIRCEYYDPPGVSIELLDLFSRIFCWEESRISLEGILAHSWMQRSKSRTRFGFKESKSHLRNCLT